MTGTPRLATYRAQLTAEFGFREAAATVDYLAALGVTHLYSSPQLQAAAGSTHGYDVVDHSRASSQLGGPEGHRELTSALARAGLGHVLDIVPNHMAIGDPGNRWWWDVLENGPASRYAPVFDVEWPDGHTADHVGDDRILLPVLGDHYVRVLAAGELHLEREGPSFVVTYYDHRFPVSPRTLDDLLGRAAERCHSGHLAFLAGAFGRLPTATSTDEDDLARRHRDKEVLRELLARALDEDKGAAAAIDEVVAELDASPEQLDALLRRQNYRLAHWRTAGQELDYRRFFDIATLAGLRTEDPAVFADTHRLVLAWCRDGRVDGLRVDHPDGLRDPGRYLERLATAAAGAWVVVEKILTGDESLPAWPVAGTTGYDFLGVVLGLFVDPAGEAPLTELHHEVTGERAELHEVVTESKRLVLDQVLGADLQRLVGHARRLVGTGGRYGDYSSGDLRAALIELLVAFPVYRTYVAPPGDGSVAAGEADRAVVAQAIAGARAARPDLDPDLFDLLGRALLLDLPDPAAVELSARFQQLSGPVMAKGVEDTAFYRYQRFVALNEVGGEPGRFGVAPEAFHAHNRRMAERWPATMTSTSTHDTKRSEDVRARMAVLSEVPGRWAEAVRRWLAANERHWGGRTPDRNAEYLLYQVLVGSHPLPADRAVAFMAKAAREAKVHTSWRAPDEAYEAALEAFVRGVVADPAFQHDLDAFVAPLVAPGRVNSLAQLLLKLASPGVPDLYQGTELWDDSLVDPDNRRPVDYGRRRRLLDWLTSAERRPDEVLARADEGVPKLWVARVGLATRRAHPDSFLPGSGYHPLEASGEAADHVVALARSPQGHPPDVVAVAPRLPVGLEARGGWGATQLALPGGTWRDAFSGRRAEGAVPLGELLADFPVALLTR